MIFTKDRKGNTQINFFPAPTPRSHPTYQFLFGATIGALGARRLVDEIKAHAPRHKGYQQVNYDSD